jgi:uncharacterized protein
MKGTRKPGEFCWINMLTPHPKEACDFFAKVLGWTYTEMPGLGFAIKVGGHDIGGLFDSDGPNSPPGTKPIIGVMVKVESADASSEKANALGGKGLPPFDIMEQGRIGVCYDPNGANIDVWQPKAMHGTEVDTDLQGAPSWFETMTTNVELAKKFYTEWFGWTSEDSPMPGFNYTTFKLAGQPVAGMMPITPEMGKISPYWGVYFTVKDAEASEREAVKLGAKSCMSMKSVSGVGHFCGLSSPQGVPFVIIQYAR